MEKIINTTKYMKAITIVLIAVAFSIISPVIALADYVDEEGYIVITDIASNDQIIPGGGSNDIIISGGGSNDQIIPGGGSNDIIIPGGGSNDTIIYGGGSNDYSYPTYYTATRQVYSGGYSGGYSTYVTPSTYYVPTATVRSGSFSGGTNYYTAPTTYYVPPATVQSGSFNGVSPTYYTQPVVQTVPNQNQVLAYNNTLPLDQVYLSDIPATGFDDMLPMIIFISSLVLWSAILAYMFLKRKIDSQTVFATVFANKNEKINSNNSVSTNFVNQIASDNSDISKVEEYARLNKVLLSSDAAVKLVKLSRLGKINASDYIRSIATGEWVAVGENQIIL